MNTTTETYSLAELVNADRDQLLQLFESRFGVSTTFRTSELLIRGNFSWALQADEEKLKPNLFQDKLIRKLEKTLSGKSFSHQPGTRLIREWHGNVYEVTVLENGYRWQGKTYESLSRIASEITGAKWSGPRFFGLK